jgi:hypothetical protein
MPIAFSSTWMAAPHQGPLMRPLAWSALAKPLPLLPVASFWHFKIGGGLRVRGLFTMTWSAKFEFSAVKWYIVLNGFMI